MEIQIHLYYIILIGFVAFLIIIEFTKKDKIINLTNYNEKLDTNIIVIQTENLTIEKPQVMFNVINIILFIVFSMFFSFLLIIITMVSFFVSLFYLFVFLPIILILFFYIKSYYTYLSLNEIIIISDHKFTLQSRKWFRKKEFKIEIKDIVKFKIENNKLQLIYNDIKREKVKMISFFKLANKEEKKWVIEKIENHLNKLLKYK